MEQQNHVHLQVTSGLKRGTGPYRRQSGIVFASIDAEEIGCSSAKPSELHFILCIVCILHMYIYNIYTI